MFLRRDALPAKLLSKSRNVQKQDQQFQMFMCKRLPRDSMWIKYVRNEKDVVIENNKDW